MYPNKTENLNELLDFFLFFFSTGSPVLNFFKTSIDFTHKKICVIFNTLRNMKNNL